MFSSLKSVSLSARKARGESLKVDSNVGSSQLLILGENQGIFRNFSHEGVGTGGSPIPISTCQNSERNNM